VRAALGVRRGDDRGAAGEAVRGQRHQQASSGWWRIMVGGVDEAAQVDHGKPDARLDGAERQASSRAISACGASAK
jgi:hypothetical protein